MKKKYWFDLALATLFIVLIIGAIIEGCERRNTHKGIAAASVKDTGRIWHDATGQEHRRTTSVTADRATMNAIHGQLIDSITRLNKIRRKQLERIEWLAAEVKGLRVAAVIMAPPAEGRRDFSFSSADDYLTFHGQSTIFNCDSVAPIQFGYNVQVPVMLTGIRERANNILGLHFGPWKTRGVDATSTNPDMHFTGVSSLDIRDRPIRWAAGPQLGVSSYDFKHWYPYAGFGITYIIVRH